MAERKTTSTRKTSERNSSERKSSSDSEARREEAINRNRKKRRNYSVVLFVIGLLLIAFSIFKLEDAPAWNAIHNFLKGIFGLSVFAIGPILIYAALMIAKDKRKAAVIVKMLQLATAIFLISGAFQTIGAGSALSLGEAYSLGKELKGGGVIGMALGFPLLKLFGRVGGSIIIVLIAFAFIMLIGNFTLTGFLEATGKPFKKAGSYAKEMREQRKVDAEYLEEAEKKRREEEVEARMKLAERNIEKEIGKKSGRTGKEVNRESANNAKNFENIDEEIAKEIERDVRFAEITAVANSAGLNKGETADLTEEAASLYATEPPPAYISGEDFNLPELAPVYDLPFPTLPPEYEVEVKDDFDAFNSAVENYKKEEDEEIKEAVQAQENLINAVEKYTSPSVNLLDEAQGRRPETDVAAELEENSRKLIEALESFGVKTSLEGTIRGPSVTRYEIKPAPGVKISKITSLADDIALNLAAAGVRIEAPIPGKSAVGVEVPNHAVDVVSIKELIDSDDFRKTDSNLGAVIGKSISGEIIISDLAKMPHLLIAGTTGSGKSVCVNSIIMSILFRSTPEEVRLIMIDPKSVEFMIYSGIPHLLAPVVTDPKKAAGALAWAVKEMTQRYSLFAENNVRDISGYNEAAKINEELQPMTKIVIFIDELADLMMTAAREVESSICRLAQMARAAGIHLVIATQRPTVNVVTGLIKANIPSRIALKVASQVDSRTIIDTAGADKLLGKGDMLYAPIGAPKPIRVQGCWVSDKEVDRVVGFIKANFELVYDESVIEQIEELAAEEISDEKASDDFDLDDDKLEEAIEAVIDAGKASTSYLQLKLKLGYGRAARILDAMEKMGVVGKYEGSKPREVIMTRQDWLERKLGK